MQFLLDGKQHTMSWFHFDVLDKWAVYILSHIRSRKNDLCISRSTQRHCIRSEIDPKFQRPSRDTWYILFTFILTCLRCCMFLAGIMCPWMCKPLALTCSDTFMPLFLRWTSATAFVQIKFAIIFAFPYFWIMCIVELLVTSLRSAATLFF